ncbi:MAG: cell envelope integrity protein TolA [Fluviibacter sp.]
MSDRLLWLAIGLSCLVHLILLAPQYGIRIPQRGDKSVMVSFHAIKQSMPHATQPPAVEQQRDARNKEARARITQPAATTPAAKSGPSSESVLQTQGSVSNPTTGGRRVSLTPGMKDYRYSQYLEDWRLKVERIGAMNYPEEARGKFFGTLVMSVALRPDGSVDRIIVLRSSGNKVLDDAAKRIVMIASPFAPFPPDIRKETDYLDITRTWAFTRGNAVETR